MIRHIPTAAASVSVAPALATPSYTPYLCHPDNAAQDVLKIPATPGHDWPPALNLLYQQHGRGCHGG